MTYIITKKSRSSDQPYEGPVCDRAGVTRGQVYTSLEQAEADAQKLSDCNPAGFVVTTKEKAQ